MAIAVIETTTTATRAVPSPYWTGAMMMMMMMMDAARSIQPNPSPRLLLSSQRHRRYYNHGSLETAHNENEVAILPTAINTTMTMIAVAAHRVPAVWNIPTARRSGAPQQEEVNCGWYNNPRPRPRRIMPIMIINEWPPCRHRRHPKAVAAVATTTAVIGIIAIRNHNNRHKTLRRRRKRSRWNFPSTTVTSVLAATITQRPLWPMVTTKTTNTRWTKFGIGRAQTTTTISITAIRQTRIATRMEIPRAKNGRTTTMMMSYPIVICGTRMKIRAAPVAIIPTTARKKRIMTRRIPTTTTGGIVQSHCSMATAMRTTTMGPSIVYNNNQTTTTNNMTMMMMMVLGGPTKWNCKPLATIRPPRRKTKQTSP
mmetsp:Transcript_23488/g.50919  ORF Transcript_23488/g.50919 Transcript_23488/m.50919 type:complete len:369 (-) Transcript_23488:3205-4311(-)